jgi:hypothetical protein
VAASHCHFFILFDTFVSDVVLNALILVMFCLPELTECFSFKWNFLCYLIATYVCVHVCLILALFHPHVLQLSFGVHIA